MKKRHNIKQDFPTIFKDFQQALLKRRPVDDKDIYKYAREYFEAIVKGQDPCWWRHMSDEDLLIFLTEIFGE